VFEATYFGPYMTNISPIFRITLIDVRIPTSSMFTIHTGVLCLVDKCTQIQN